MKSLYLVMFVFAAFPAFCSAELVDENLLVSVPDGYKIDFQTKRGRLTMTEMVPTGESVENWTEMVTTQVFLGLTSAPPAQFKTLMAKQWIAACPGGTMAPVSEGVENGYTFSLWLQLCPRNPSTGKPENTWFKAIQGNDSFYLVQKAFRFDPTHEQIDEWMHYFRKVAVCDSRLDDRPCPKVVPGTQ